MKNLTGCKWTQVKTRVEMRYHCDGNCSSFYFIHYVQFTVAPNAAMKVSGLFYVKSDKSCPDPVRFL